MNAEINSIQKEINCLGEEMIKCKPLSNGLACKDVDEAILPRCLYLETEQRSADRGLIAIGINPGQANRDERQVLQGIHNFECLCNYARDNGIPEHLYHVNARKLIKLLGFEGPILWSELAKCQKAEKVSSLSIFTLSRCIKEHLKKEIKAVPKDWPLFGLSEKAFTALKYLYPHRAVIGFYHPTGARVNWDDELEKVKQRDDEIKKLIEECKQVWLPGFLRKDVA